MHELPIVREYGKNYFVAASENKRFLFSRIRASSFIATPETEIMDSFEVQRQGSIILAGGCYSLLGRIPVYWLEYSEISCYSTIHNGSCPHEILFADDLKPGDVILSNMDVAAKKARGFDSLFDLLAFIDTSMSNFKRAVESQANFSGTVTVSGNPIRVRPTKNSLDVLDIQTFIVPEHLSAL